MDIDEAEAWLRAQMADPAKRARAEAYYAAHSICLASLRSMMMAMAEQARPGAGE